jgi:nucleotide-binding universal stress UspA family protein|tara:strand:+ start:4658 stop:5599 length:942 start_codon:yes stop_codon:yes gene_type:complete
VEDDNSTEQNPAAQAGIFTMISNDVVIGLDDSANSHHALSWACKQRPTRVHAVNAVPPATELWFPARQVDSRLTLDIRRQNLDQLCNSVRLTSDIRINGHLSDQEPARALVERSHAEGGCPIVVGHKGHSSPHRHHAGHITAELLRNSDVPVVVVPMVASLEPLNGTIALCAHGATTIDHPDVAWAIELATAHDLNLHLVDVVEPIPVGLGADYGYGTVTIPTADQLLASRSESLAALSGQIEASHPSLTVRRSVESGHPSIQLARVINDLAPSLVVIGNHHHSKLLSFLTSAVTTHLLTSLACPIAAIPIPK